MHAHLGSTNVVHFMLKSAQSECRKNKTPHEHIKSELQQTERGKRTRVHNANI